MTSKKTKSHHPDMERALHPEEKIVTVPKEIQFFTDYSRHHPLAKLLAKPKYLPRQFKNLPSSFQLEPDLAPKSPMDQGCSKTCISVKHHGFLNPMTPEDLYKKYFGDEEFLLGEYDDPPLHTLEKPWETCENYEKSLVTRKPIQGGTMIKFQADEPAPPEYQVNKADRNKSKKVNRSGTGKKKTAKAKKKAAKAKKLAKAHQSSSDTTFNKCNAIPDTAEELTTTSLANEGHELVPLPPPLQNEELEPLSDILTKISICKYMDFEQNENGTNTIYQNVVTENNDVQDNRESFFCSEDKKTMNKVNKEILIMNNELSDDKASADDEADSFNKWYAANRLADSAKSDACSWWQNYLECPQRFKLFPDAAMDACSPAHLKNISKLTQSRSEQHVGMCRA